MMIRGGQTLLHSYRMMGQVIKLMVIIFLGTAALAAGMILGCQTTLGDWSDEWLWQQAMLASQWGNRGTVLVTDAHDYPYQVSAQALLQDHNYQQRHRQRLTVLRQAMRVSLEAGGLSVLLVGIGLAYRGKRLAKPRLLQGRYVGTPRVLKRKMKALGPLSSLNIAGIPLPQEAETQHFLFHGTTGSGKSVSIRALLDQIKARGERAVVYDRHGDFLQYYYEAEQDKLLNPLDKRCEAWDVWAECQETAHFDQLAAALMPMPLGQSGDPFWINAARTLFAAGAYQLRHDTAKSTEALLRLLLMSDMGELSQLLKGTEAESLISEKTEKTALSIKSVLATYLKSLKYLTHSETPFSIRQWLQQEDKAGWLFVTSRSDKHEAIKPLISLWLDLVANGLMALPPDPTRRIWLILDELPSLQRLPYLPQAFAESRKFGGCLVAGMQSYFQLQKIYGQDGAKAMVDLCNTRLFLAAASHESAKWVSHELGDAEFIEVRDGISYGANTIRDGVSLNHQRVTKPAVSSATIMNLPSLQGYLSMTPGRRHYAKIAAMTRCWPVVPVTIPFEAKPVQCASFCAREHTDVMRPEIEQVFSQAAAQARRETMTSGLSEYREDTYEL